MKSFPKAALLAALLAPRIEVASANKKAACPQEDAIPNVVLKTNGDRVEDSYTIVFNQLETGHSLEDTAEAAISETGGKVDRSGLLPLINGALATMTEVQAEAMAKRPEVKYIQENAVLRMQSSCVAPWGLDRINQRDLPLDSFYNNTANAPTQGSGTVVYVVDSGIQPDHPEFSPPGRAHTSAAYDFIVPEESDDRCNDETNGTDCDGHGTHVSGIIGGNTVGVAPHTKLVGVKVFDCCGDTKLGWILQALDKVGQDCPNGTSIKEAPFPNKKCIINMSLGDPSYNQALNEYVTKLSEQGMIVAVAAGNDAKDTCDTSPGSAVGAFTVGGTDSSDEIYTQTNFGPAVDIFAPAVDILSSDIDIYGNADGCVNSTGTSQAAPHVAGVAALLHGEHPELSAEEVTAKILADATEGKITGLEEDKVESPNLLLYIPTATVSTMMPTNPTKPVEPTSAPTQSESPTSSPVVLTLMTNSPTRSPSVATRSNAGKSGKAGKSSRSSKSEKKSAVGDEGGSTLFD